MTEHGSHTSGIDHSVHGLTQLRVHGVSGTPAAAMLEHPPDLLHRERGDRRAGFYRRWYPGGTTPDNDAGRLEAYSWGGLTSGPASRALWLLFLPFVLVDLAHWMLPPMAPGRPDRSARLASSTLRLLALSLTFTFLLAIAVVTLDLGAWQCAPNPRCASRFAPLGWISGLDPGARLAVAALVPAAIVAILWRLGRQDLRPRTDHPPGPEVQLTARPLADPAFWNGDDSEVRLRAVHVAAWSSALGALVLAPTLQAASNDVGRAVVAVLLALHLGVLGACIVVTGSERITGRGGHGAPKATRPLQRLRWGSLLLLGSGLVVTAVVPADWQDPAAGASALPYLREVVPDAFYVQVLLLVLLLVAVAIQQPWQIGRDRPGFAVVLRGLAAPATAFSAWLVAVTFGVGIGLAAAKFLGVAVNSPETAQQAAADAAVVLASPTSSLGAKIEALQRQPTLIVPPGYFWTGTAVVVMLVALVLLVLGVVAYVVRTTNRLALEVLADYPGQRAPDRARGVARGRTLAGLTDHVDQLVGPLLLVALLEVVVGSVLYLVFDFDAVEREDWIGDGTAFGVYLTGLAAAGLVSLGFLAFRDGRIRRYVGILWDVATFWPRANHPLTPPCYGERAVPELKSRTAELTSEPGDVVVLSAHSQGSVLAAAMLMRAQHGPGRVVLLTYGAPLRRLYARFFPAYFGPMAFEDTFATTGHRWTNLYALSDPIGAWVLTEAGGVDVRVVEPTTLEPRADASVAPTCGHSGYTGFDDYDAAVQTLTSGPGAGTGEVRRM